MRWGGWRNRVKATLRSWVCREPNLSIIHEFQRPPYGGGNQFLLALEKEWQKRGIPVLRNSANAHTRAILFNSFNFDFEFLQKLRQAYPKARFVHRLDGPVSVYRGKDFEVDQRIFALNLKSADASVFQSQYSLDKTRELGLEFKPGSVIHNAVDPGLFYPKKTMVSNGKSVQGTKIRLICSSWSDHPNKGGAFLKWLDGHLDWNRFEMIFLGRTRETFENISVQPPVGSAAVADLLRKQDLFLFPSRFDSCSNSVLEALACGLPVVYHSSGGTPELVQKAGEGFETPEEMALAIEKVAGALETYREAIRLQSMEQVAEKYLRVMNWETESPSSEARS